MTVWVGEDLTPQHSKEVNMLLKGLGEVIEVEEEDMIDWATAMSGSGPGYIFLIMESMIDAGVHLGFPRRVAEKLVFQTVRMALLISFRVRCFHLFVFTLDRSRGPSSMLKDLAGM